MMVTVVVARALLPAPSLATTVMMRGVVFGSLVGVAIGHRPEQRDELGQRLRRRGRDRQHAQAGRVVS